jgi:glycosyltransferase involved in cell wall biosynthesis
VNPGRPTLAILPWGTVFEEYLDPLGISLEEFRTQVTDGWLFNYVRALDATGIDATIILVSTSIRTPLHSVHEPTGCGFVALPAPVGLRSIHTARKFKRTSFDGGSRGTQGGTGGESGSRSRRSFGVPDAVYRMLVPTRALESAISEAGCQGILCQEYEDVRFDASVEIGRKVGIPTFGIFQGGELRTVQPDHTRTRAIQGCAGLIIGSREEAARVRGMYGVEDERIAPLPNPVHTCRNRNEPRAEVRSRLGLHQEARVAAWHGRIMRWKKGLDILVDAWRRLGASPERCQLLLVGWGSDGEWLREEIRAELESGSIRWVDRFVRDRSELCGYLSATDLYVFPSRHEGFPVAPLEAMSLGLPMIGGEAQGVDEILEVPERDGGVRVSGEDSAGLAEALRTLLEDRERSRALGEAARQRVEEHFSVEAVGSQLGSWLRGRGFPPSGSAE